MGRSRTTPSPLVIYGVNAVIELLRSDGATHVYLGPGPRSAEIAETAAAQGVAVERVDRGALDRLARTPHHQGVAAVARPFSYAPLERLLEVRGGAAVVLDGIQDPRNLGAILRTARAAGVAGVVLPRDRSVGVTPVVVSASAGLVFGLSVAQVPNVVRAMEQLKEAGYWLVGLAAREGRPPASIDVSSPTALVVGGEGGGLRPLVGRSCDFLATIPMAPGVESLNVAVATGMALYEFVIRGRPS
jgi:23S rRNA (guanosine2251-2'-O)-methyltransferase